MLKARSILAITNFAITALIIITIAITFLSAASSTAADASVYPAGVSVYSEDASDYSTDAYAHSTGDVEAGAGSTDGAELRKSSPVEDGAESTSIQITDSINDVRGAVERSLAEVDALGAVDLAIWHLKDASSAVLNIAADILNEEEEKYILSEEEENQEAISRPGTYDLAFRYPQVSYPLLLKVILALMLCLAYFPFFKGEDWTGCRTEAEFDERCIKPLLKSWGFIYNYQKPCEIRRGSEVFRGRIDFYVYDGNRPLTLFEDKLSIDSTGDLEDACDQARSYALQFRLNNYVIASRQGLKLYRFEVSGDTLIKSVSPRRLTWWNKRGLKRRILKLRGHGKVQDRQSVQDRQN